MSNTERGAPPSKLVAGSRDGAFLLGANEMKCEICEKDIGEDRLSQSTKVSLFCHVSKRRVEYHAPCWNKRVSDQIRKEDAMIDGHRKP